MLRRYRVEVCSTVWEWRAVEVLADSEADAERLAVDRVCDPDQPEIPVRRMDSGGIEATDCERVTD